MDMQEVQKEVYEALDLLRNSFTIEEMKYRFFVLNTFRYLNESDDHPFHIPTELRWNALRADGFNLGKRLDKAFKVLEEENPALDGVFTIFPFGMLTETQEDATLFRIMTIVERLPLGKEAGDFADFLFSFFSDREGRAGDLVTPPEIPDLLTRLLEIKNGTVYDGTAGIAQFLVKAYEYARIQSGEVQLYGQEVNSRVLALSKMNFILHGIYDLNLKLGDVIIDPLWKENDKQLKKFDYVIMEPPFGLSRWGRKAAEEDLYGRFRFGIPSAASGDMAFVQHAVASMNEKGKAAVIVPPGVLFRGGPDQRIREELLKEDLIDAVIHLPSNLYVGSGIPVVILLFNKAKQMEHRGKVQMIQADQDYLKRRAKHILRTQDIDKIVHTYQMKAEIEQYSRIVSLSELKENEWMLNPKRYFGSAEIETPIGTVQVNWSQYEALDFPKVELGDIANVFRGLNTPSAKEFTMDTEYTHKLINLADVQDGQILFDTLTPIYLDDKKKIRSYEVQPGDVILSSRGLFFKIAIIPPTHEKLILSSNFIGIRPGRNVDSGYIKAFLESPIGRYYISLHQKGAAISMISHKDIEKLPILLLSLAQQQKLSADFMEADRELKETIAAAERKHKEQYRKLYEDMGIMNIIE
ncbi:N-6 DNA methylase [Aneurinibacillus danicus]|uniref:site-specific DNA-methyltransferase (adenine-specific) n=1 Tax=Aneurinibacillus danicus TaxID=267746 RepID=A0A511VCG3_9BACL|nr:N-6 DNA methylase [Aneurinibacillus danicus]GEN36606.1 hypothetical protein ADA01nite_40660 [Aneurinibacillus danicus]